MLAWEIRRIGSLPRLHRPFVFLSRLFTLLFRIDALLNAPLLFRYSLSIAFEAFSFIAMGLGFSHHVSSLLKRPHLKHPNETGPATGAETRIALLVTR